MQKRKFEYYINVFDTTLYGFLMEGDAESDLNTLGEDGWELVSVSDKVAYLKREVQDAEQ